MSKESFSKRLNIALDKCGYPEKGKGRQAKVAKTFCVSPESARKWLEGEVHPDTKRIPEIAKTLHVNQTWLETGVGDIRSHTKPKDFPSEESPNWRKVPMLSWSEAGSWESVVPYILEHDDNSRKWAWAESLVSPDSYALQIPDDSMMPRYEPNSILIIDPHYQATHKHIVIYCLDGMSEVVCKQLIIDGNNWLLVPHNPSYPVVQITGKDKYCGSIRQAKMSY